MVCNNIYAQSSDTLENSVVTDTLSINIEEPVHFVKSLPGAYFNSSCGDDRLGGNKISFIQQDIVFRVLGDTSDLYKVGLSENRYAYIPKEMVADTVVEKCPGAAISGSVSVSNSGGYDRISIALSDRRPYIIREETDPRKMVIELYGVQNNSNWITQYTDLMSVSEINVLQKESDVLVFTVGLKGKSSWGYSAYYQDNRLVIDIKHQPELSLKGMVIGIDAGHGGESSSGAIGRTSRVQEKVLNLDMAKRLKKILEKKGARVILSRTEDVEVSMAERKAIFLENDIDLMVSIHCNAGGTARGTSTYYKHIQYRPLAESILKRLLEIDGVNLFGLVGNFNFSLNAPTEYPTVLVETLFLSNAEDEAMLNSPKFRETMMKQVAAGLQDYLKYCKQ